MKKSILLFAFTLFSASVFAQAFHKGTQFIGLGFGLGIQHYQYTDLSNHVTSARDTSAALEIPLRYEYGIFNWLGIGLDANYASYINGDSASNQSVKGIDFVPTLSLHAPFGWKKLDFSGNAGYGFSHFSYKVNDTQGGKAIANGAVFNLGLDLRLLFGAEGHFGMDFWYRHSSYTYNKGTITDNSGNKADFKLEGPGNNFGIGFLYHFH